VIWEANRPGAEGARDPPRWFVAEYRFAATSEHLLTNLTKMKAGGHIDKFQMSFETRHQTGKGGLPDPTKDDFFNVIRQIYDSAMDLDHATRGFVNANLDVQHYYAPALTSEIPRAALGLQQEFDKRCTAFLRGVACFGVRVDDTKGEHA